MCINWIIGPYCEESRRPLKILTGKTGTWQKLLCFWRNNNHSSQHEKENDQIYTLNEFPIFIDKSQELYLHDCEIDFKGGLDNRGFVFNNPNATTTCGCGTSFSA